MRIKTNDKHLSLSSRCVYILGHCEQRGRDRIGRYTPQQRRPVGTLICVAISSYDVPIATQLNLRYWIMYIALAERPRK